MMLIDADALMEKLNGIWDCNDMTFAPVDECCIDADCKSCRWRETIEYVKRLVQNQPTASPWHRVEEELPKETKIVVTYGKGHVSFGYYLLLYDADTDKEVVEWFDYCGNRENVTHWMPLSEPPKEG